MAAADVVTKGGHAEGASQAWRALMRDKNLQFDFPDAAGETTTPAWFLRLTEFLRAHDRELEIAGWLVLAAIGLTIAYYLIRWLMRRDWTRETAPEAPSWPAWQPSARQARLLLRDADALAAEGRYAEAAHLLLLVSIQEISDRRPGEILPALTSREIAMLREISPMAQRIFSEIALVVERCVFGGRTLGATEFAQCRGAFEQFTIPQAWGMA